MIFILLYIVVFTFGAIQDVMVERPTKNGASFNDDETKVFEKKAKSFKIYRAEEFGCIIQILG